MERRNGRNSCEGTRRGGRQVELRLNWRSRNQRGRVFDAETRRRGEKNAEEDGGQSTPKNAEEAERRGLAPREFRGGWRLSRSAAGTLPGSELRPGLLAVRGLGAPGFGAVHVAQVLDVETDGVARFHELRHHHLDAVVERRRLEIGVLLLVCRRRRGGDLHF